MMRTIRIMYVVLILFIYAAVASSGTEKNRDEKFSLPAYTRLLLNETDMVGYKLKYQRKDTWPETEKDQEPKMGITQCWFDSSGRSLYCEIWIFDSVEEAMDRAKFLVTHVAVPYQEGSFSDTIVGNKSWIGVQREGGAAFLFIYEEHLVSIMDPYCRGDQKKKLQVIAGKILKKIKNISGR